MPTLDGTIDNKINVRLFFTGAGVQDCGVPTCASVTVVFIAARAANQFSIGKGGGTATF